MIEGGCSIFGKILRLYLEICYGSIKKWPARIRFHRRGHRSYRVSQYDFDRRREGECWKNGLRDSSLDVEPSKAARMMAKALRAAELRKKMPWLDALDVVEVTPEILGESKFDARRITFGEGFSARVFAKMGTGSDIVCPASLTAREAAGFDEWKRNERKGRKERRSQLFLDLIKESIGDILDRYFENMTDDDDLRLRSVILSVSPDGRCGAFAE